MDTRRKWVWAVFLASSFVNGLLIWHFHDRYFYPTDDGLYAHIAERLLNGAVMNRDVQDLHLGYIHFLHEAAFRVFGTDMVSLRYPLALAAFVLSALTYALLQRRDVVLAALGSIAMTALGVIQFFDPGPNWYCLLLGVMLACWMTWIPSGKPVRLFGAGVLLGVLTLLRQLSGVWAAMGLLVFVVLERSDPGRPRGGWVARALILTMLAGLTWYLVGSPGTQVGGSLLVAVWPFAILGWALVNVRAPNGGVASDVAQVAAGSAISALPLVLYHLSHQSTKVWLGDTLFFGLKIMTPGNGADQVTFFHGGSWLALLPLAGLYQAVSTANPVMIANGLYWVVLPLVSVANGIVILLRLSRYGPSRDLALPIVASFYALVSVFLEGPLYLYYVVGLSLISLAWFAATGSSGRRVACAAVLTALSVMAVVFHAGQTRLRTSREILEGQRLTNTWDGGGEGLDRCSLRLDQSDRAFYGRLVRLIQRETPPDASILAVPNDSELYFLARRRNPFRFYNASAGILTAEDLADAIRQMIVDPPRLVTFRPLDKYNTRASRQLMDFVRTRYVHTDTFDDMEIYALR